jgi:shikimate kinase
MVASDKAIVLVGPAGVGKTTVGKKLANALGMTFVDTDALFVRDHGSIADFFAHHGESAFRKLEEDYLAFAVSTPGIVATGGGIVLSPLNRANLKSTKVVYLKTDGTHMAKRISQGNRPLLKNGIEDWRRLYDQRKELYDEVADITIDCSGHPIKQTVNEIRTELDKHD